MCGTTVVTGYVRSASLSVGYAFDGLHEVGIVRGTLRSLPQPLFAYRPCGRSTNAKPQYIKLQYITRGKRLERLFFRKPKAIRSTLLAGPGLDISLNPVAIGMQKSKPAVSP